MNEQDAIDAHKVRASFEQCFCKCDLSQNASGGYCSQRVDDAWEGWRECATIKSSPSAPIAQQEPVAPSGWKLVPIEPTENMIIEGFESVPDRHFDGDKYPDKYDDMSGCEQAAFRAKRCYTAMLAAAPQPIPQDKHKEN